MSVILYDAPESTCSQRVRFVLNAKAIPFKEVHVDLKADEHVKPAYLALNPNGVVPTLVHNGDPVIDSSVIIEYLDEVFSDVQLTPRDAIGRAKMRSLMRFIDEVPAAAVRVPTFNLVFLPFFSSMNEKEFQAFAERRPLRKELMLQMGRAGFTKEEMDSALDRIGRAYSRMEAAISASGGPWLLGKDISLADAMIMPVVVRMADLGFASMWDNRPAIARWYEAICAHSAFETTYYPGSMLSELYPHVLKLKHR